MRAEVTALFRRAGHLSYGEGVSILDHSLQVAHFATRDGGDAALVSAALLHDVGHLLHEFGEDIADRGVDTGHEILGARWLEGLGFPPEVTVAVARHVDAKRYLCAVEPGYSNGLSDASRLSLSLQGGVMSASEAERFIAQPHAARAVALRRYDDWGKVDDLKTAPLSEVLAVAQKVCN